MPIHYITAPGSEPRVSDIQFSDAGSTDFSRVSELWMSPVGSTTFQQYFRFGRRYAVVDRGYLYILDNDGNIAAQHAVGTTPPFDAEVIAANNNKVYIFNETTVRVFNATTGAEILAESITVPTGVISMTILSSKLYCLVGGTRVRVYNLSTRRELTSEAFNVAGSRGIAGVGTTIWSLSQRVSRAHRTVRSEDVTYVTIRVDSHVDSFTDDFMFDPSDDESRSEAFRNARAFVSSIRESFPITRQTGNTITTEYIAEVDGPHRNVSDYNVLIIINRRIQRIVRTPSTRTVTDTTYHRRLTPYSLTGTAGNTRTASGNTNQDAIEVVPSDIGSNGNTLLAVFPDNISSMSTTNATISSVIADTADTVDGDGTNIFLGRDRFINAYTTAYRENDARSFVTGDLAAVANSSGLAWTGSHYYVVTEGSRNVKAFTTAGLADTTKDFTLHVDNADPDGIAWDPHSNVFWVIDNRTGTDRNNLFAYNASGVYQSAMSRYVSTIHTGRGIAVDATNIYVDYVRFVNNDFAYGLLTINKSTGATSNRILSTSARIGGASGSYGGMDYSNDILYYLSQSTHSKLVYFERLGSPVQGEPNRGVAIRLPLSIQAKGLAVIE